MPTAFSDLSPVRRVAVGDCDGPLGSGFDALARSAYAALLRADWVEDSSAPFLPVHDNGQTANKAIPRGDAWKCTYGYDAAARTERSACGAVCYSFALPLDAIASGNVANIASVALSLTGDRYLDAGVDLYCVLSSSATPPVVSTILAGTPVGTYCATSGQAPTKPNERHGVTAPVSWEPTATPAQAYLHVALLLHDYTTNRGAWIEGGAMLEGATATITFSRDVSDAGSAVRILRVTGTPPEGGTSKFTVAVGTLDVAYYVLGYQYGAGPPPAEDYEADMPTILSLAASGGIPVSADRSAFVPYSGLAYGCFSEWRSSSYYDVCIVSASYFAPAAPIRGLDVEYPFQQFDTSPAGTVRVAMMQSASATPESIAALALQAARGSGRDLLGYADVVLPAVSQTTRRSATIRISANPSRPYILAVLLPMTLGAAANLGHSSDTFDDAILLAAPPSA